MRRCEQSAGEYRVGLTILHSKEERRVQIQGHTDVVAYTKFSPNGDPLHEGREVLEAAPSVGTAEAYEGELCVHELAWLEAEPGVSWSPTFDWTIEKLT